MHPPGDGLEAHDAAAAELTESGQGVFEAVDGAEGVEFVDDEPEFLISFGVAHGFENGESHPGADEVAEGGDFVGSVRKK